MPVKSLSAVLGAAILLLSLCSAAFAQEQPPIQPAEEGETPTPGYIYLYLDGELVQAQRDITGGGQMVEFALLELFNGPTEEEEAAGYVTYIPQGVKLQYTTVKQDRSEFSVNLSRELLELSGDRESSEKALTQIVRTAQDVSDITNIGITVAGEAMGDPPQDAFEALGVSRDRTGTGGQGAGGSEDGSSTGLVLGIVFGLLGAAILAFLALYFFKRNRPTTGGKTKGRPTGGKAAGKKDK
jgi:hypothetical protein